MARDCQEWRKIVWEAKVQNGLQCSRRRRVVYNTNKNNIILVGITELQLAQNCLNHWGYRIAEGPLYLEVLLIQGCRNHCEALMLVVFVLAGCSSIILIFLRYQNITGLIHSFMGTILFLNCHSFITLDLPCVGKGDSKSSHQYRTGDHILNSRVTLTLNQLGYACVIEIV